GGARVIKGAISPRDRWADAVRAGHGGRGGLAIGGDVRAAAEGRGAGGAVAVPGTDGQLQERGRLQGAHRVRLDADGRGGAERAAEQAARRAEGVSGAPR